LKNNSHLTSGRLETGSSVSWLKGSDIGTPAIDGSNHRKSEGDFLESIPRISKLLEAHSFADGHSDYHKWEDSRTIAFGKRIPPTAFSENQPGNPDLHWAAVAMWGKDAMHR
jgi:hypothetical protein